METESNQQLAKEACYNTVSTPNQVSHLAGRTLNEEELSEAHANLRWDRYNRLRKTVYLAAMDTVMAEEWEWESHWDSEGEDPEASRPHMRNGCNLAKTSNRKLATRGWCVC